MKIEESEVYTTKELAQILKISYPTIKRMLKDKRLTSTRVGRQHRFLGRDVLQILAEQQDLRTPPVEAIAASAQPSYEPEYVNKLSSVERYQRAYMLGKKVASDLYSDYGVLIVSAGRVVDDKIIRNVHAHRKMTELFTKLEDEE
ncbi:MAG: helix-turn-helix domain-containing protein [bacterium]